MRIECQIVGDLPAKAAVFFIDGVVEPEGQNAGQQLSFNALQ